MFPALKVKKKCFHLLIRVHEAGSTTWPVIKCHSRSVFYQRKYLKMKCEIRYGEFLIWKRLLVNTKHQLQDKNCFSLRWWVVHHACSFQLLLHYKLHPKSVTQNNHFFHCISWFDGAWLVAFTCYWISSIQLTVKQIWKVRNAPQHVWHLIMFS